ncbi:MAG: shikimate dehydrogenase [Pseudomonadota bacterium]
MSAKLAVFGNPIAQSKSPQIHQLFAAQFNLSIEYDRRLSTDTDFIGDLQAFFNEGGLGCNVTAPFKEQAFTACDTLTEAASRACAVNTVFKQTDGTLLGHNSDGIGLVQDIVVNKQVPIRNSNIIILGAGGATRGILEPIIAAQPARLTIANRTASKAVTLAGEFADIYPIRVTSTEHPEYDAAPDILINATSASLSSNLPVSDAGLATAHTLCYDLSYRAEPTAFLQWASANGATRCYDGKGMLVEQAANSFALWTDKKPATAEALTWLENPEA